MLNNEALIKSLEKNFDKDIYAFVHNIKDRLAQFDIYGLNISIYLNRGEKTLQNKDLYDIYSFDYSEEPSYYNKLWQDYLNIYNKFSSFNADVDIQNGWYDSSKHYTLEVAVSNDFKNLQNVKSKFIEKEISKPCKIEYSQKIYPEDFIHVNKGWEKYIDELSNKKFNLRWVASFIHIPISEEFEYKHWYISCYLLLNIGDSIKIKPGDKNNYKSVIRPNINKLLFNTSLSLHEILIEEKQNDLERQTIKAAVSQVNARTTSHNTGSHILTNEIENNQSTLEEIRKNINELSDLFGHEQKKSINKKLGIIGNKIDKIENLTVELKMFRTYLRQRMLYNADIASSASSSDTAIQMSEVLISFEKLEIVKNFISGIKDEKFYQFHKTNVGDLIIALPNEVLGFQALYIMFENIIRNYFKHAKGSGRHYEQDEGLSISIIELIEESDLYYYCFEISDGSLIDEERFERISRLIHSPILENNELRKEGLGYLEIKAALCYLNNIPIENIDRPLLEKSSTNFVFSVQPIDISNQTLRYKFYLRKPFFIRVLRSNSLNEHLLHKGIVDSKIPTDLDRLCPFYISKNILINSNITPRVFDDYDLMLENPEAINIDSEIDSAYYFWLSSKFNEEYSIYNLEGQAEHLTYKKIIRTDTGFLKADITHLNSTEFSILFDDHSKSIDTILKLRKINPNIYYEDYKSDSVLGEIFRDLDNQKCYILKRLFEAAKINILIIDERIQRYASNLYYKVNSSCKNEIVSIQEMLLMSNVFVPLPDSPFPNDCINLNQIKFNENFVSKIKKCLTDNLKPECMNFIVIHLGIIEKLTVNKSPERISELIEQMKPTCIPDHQVVLTSERGTPDNVEGQFRFLHFSNLSKHIIEDKSKLNLVNSILNSRSLFKH